MLMVVDLVVQMLAGKMEMKLICLSFIYAFNSICSHVCRSYIHLHFSDCPRRMVKCAVKGCHNYYALGAESDHNTNYQESHQVLLKNEVERLRGVLFNKVHAGSLRCVWQKQGD